MKYQKSFVTTLRYFLYMLFSFLFALWYLDDMLASFFHDLSGYDSVWISNYGHQFFAHLTLLAEPQYAVIPALIWWLYGRLYEDNKITFQGRFAFICLSVTGLIVPVLKFIFRRARPSLYFTDAVACFFIY